MTRDIPARAPHPLIDAGGDGWLHVESRAAIVALTPAIANLLTVARDAGRAPILVTDQVAALTPAFAQVWRAAGGRWVVRSRDGLHDGTTGRRLTAVPDVLERVPVRDPDQVAPAFLAPRPATALELHVVASTRHRVSRSVLLGGAAAQLAGLDGGELRAWGAHEPAVTTWDRAALTEFARQRMPADSLVVAVGDGFAATIEVRRTVEGLEEVTRAALDLGVPGAAGFTALLDRLDAALHDLGRSGMPLVAFATVRPSTAPLRIGATLPHPPAPLRLLVGPPGVRALGIPVTVHRERFAAEPVGRPRLPGVLYRLGALGDPDAWKRLDEVLRDLDRDVLDDLLGGALRDLPGGDDAEHP